ncbi:hypothetical protein ABE42_28720 [Bacillus thuringiensis]|uniref:hypothetical protein n=1 Tax=Bacillus TaxID=1386 RepID=UPI00019FED1A|nr:MULTISPECIES: hypothetical protein [Bacillus]MBG9583096.1 hypothetical protein [Bacillus thuringiensis]MDJ0280525.1 hypothetical protein [Bacillus bombysepticus]EEK48049.1 hypothetical protein bcere0002_48510 [Bacillus cereus ATCC 10876]KFL79115.1 hypothetical protein DJ50_5558 [Bacillus cereus ATCC 10876]MBG9866195.1 hypothetical protein [Bacillus cereus]
MGKYKVEWKLHEEFKKQDKKALEFIAEYQQKVQAAKENVTAATVAYEAILQREFAGEEVAAEKQEALDNIDKGRAAVKVAEEEHSKANDYANEHLRGKITLEDLTADWNGNMRPSIRGNEFADIKQRAHEGLKAYYEAVQDLIALENACSAALSDSGIGERLQRHRSHNGYTVLHEPASIWDFVKIHPTEADWYNITNYRKVPAKYRN